MAFYETSLTLTMPCSSISQARRRTSWISLLRFSKIPNFAFLSILSLCTTHSYEFCSHHNSEFAHTKIAYCKNRTPVPQVDNKHSRRKNAKMLEKNILHFMHLKGHFESSNVRGNIFKKHFVPIQRWQLLLPFNFRFHLDIFLLLYIYTQKNVRNTC